MAALPERVAADQLRAFNASARRCAACGRARAVKDRQTRAVDSVFGRLRPDSPRCEPCRCGAPSRRSAPASQRPRVGAPPRPGASGAARAASAPRRRTAVPAGCGCPRHLPARGDVLQPHHDPQPPCPGRPRHRGRFARRDRRPETAPCASRDDDGRHRRLLLQRRGGAPQAEHGGRPRADRGPGPRRRSLRVRAPPRRLGQSPGRGRAAALRPRPRHGGHRALGRGRTACGRCWAAGSTRPSSTAWTGGIRVVGSRGCARASSALVHEACARGKDGLGSAPGGARRSAGGDGNTGSV